MSVTTDGIRQQELELKQQLEDLTAPRRAHRHAGRWDGHHGRRARPDSRAASSQGSSV
jgi:hypothetical protein